MPKRLIDLGTSRTQPGPKLIYPRGRQEQYLTLSYCWGDAKPYKTTAQNIARMEKFIPTQTLPQTIRDAFQVAHELNVQYIWIDALCIIQDNKEEWDEESKRMGAIYVNSFATIAATCAENSGQGFLRSRTIERVEVPFRMHTKAEPEEAIYFRRPSDLIDDHVIFVRGSPLQKRAWVLQEMLLSRRIIHFSSKQIYWECRTTFGAEDGITEGADSREHTHEFLDALSSLQDGMVSDMHGMIFFAAWARVVQRYSTLSMSKQSDKLPALSGLASLAEPILGHSYLYGIWNFNLPYGLFWHPLHRPAQRPHEWRAPSWSWAAQEGEILFENYFPLEDSCISFREALGDIPQGALRLKGRIQACYVSLDLQPQPRPCRSDRKLREVPATPSEYAFAVDEKTLLEYQASTETKAYDLNGTKPGVSLLRVTEGRLMGVQGYVERNVCRFDAERGNNQHFHFLRLACCSGMDFHHCRGLLLRQTTIGTYERVGVGWSTDAAWHTVQESIVTLI